MKTHMLEVPGGFRIACGKFVENQDAKTSDPEQGDVPGVLEVGHLPARGIRPRRRHRSVMA